MKGIRKKMNQENEIWNICLLISSNCKYIALNFWINSFFCASLLLISRYFQLLNITLLDPSTSICMHLRGSSFTAQELLESEFIEKKNVTNSLYV